MNFKELRKGLPVYILNKESMEYTIGKVSQDATPPRLNNNFGQPMIVDVSIEANSQIKIWTLPADQQIAETQSDSNIVISTDKSTLVSILKSIESECDHYLQGVGATKIKLEKAKKLIADLDITYKQQQQTEERFSHLEQSIEQLNSTLSQILKAVKS